MQINMVNLVFLNSDHHSPMHVLHLVLRRAIALDCDIPRHSVTFPPGSTDLLTCRVPWFRIGNILRPFAVIRKSLEGYHQTDQSGHCCAGQGAGENVLDSNHVRVYNLF